MKRQANEKQVTELLYQAIETERGGIKIYTAALQNAVNEALHKEWEEYLEETKNHERVLTNVFEEMGLDTEAQTPGRAVVAYQGASLVEAIEMARASGDPVGAQLVAAECVVLAETKDHQNWELIGKVAEHAIGETKRVLQAAYDAVEDDEDHHLYHTKGWCRELWIESLGFPAVLPPPEEVKQVETAIGAARAEKAREEML
jgi:rubrerythrin